MESSIFQWKLHGVVPRLRLHCGWLTFTNYDTLSVFMQIFFQSSWLGANSFPTQKQKEESHNIVSSPWNWFAGTHDWSGHASPPVNSFLGKVQWRPCPPSIRSFTSFEMFHTHIPLRPMQSFGLHFRQWRGCFKDSAKYDKRLESVRQTIKLMTIIFQTYLKI